jgi:hypothetical protein
MAVVADITPHYPVTPRQRPRSSHAAAQSIMPVTSAISSSVTLRDSTQTETLSRRATNMVDSRSAFISDVSLVNVGCNSARSGRRTTMPSESSRSVCAYALRFAPTPAFPCRLLFSFFPASSLAKKSNSKLIVISRSFFFFLLELAVSCISDCERQLRNHFRAMQAA